MTQSRTDRFRRPVDALWRAVPSGVVVLGRAGTPVRVNGPGRAVWEALAQAGTRDELVSMLGRDLHLDPPAAATVVDSVLGQLVEQGVVEVSS